jgi:hypothetical protein
MPDELGIRREWDELYERADPSLLLARFPDNIVLTVSSLVVFRDVSRLSHWNEIRIRYLTGPKEAMLENVECRPK